MTAPVTVDDLRAATWTLSMHLNMGAQGHHMTHSCPEFPELLVLRGWRRGAKAARKSHYHVIELRRPNGDRIEYLLADLDGVVRDLNKLRQGLADDLEWAAASPDQLDVAAIDAAFRRTLAEKNP